MKNELENMQRLLEAVTAPGDAPIEALDPETASLREAWLALGQLLEAVQPAVGAAVQLPHQPVQLPHQPVQLPHQPVQLPHQPVQLPQQPGSHSPLPLGEAPTCSPLPLGEGQGVRAVPRPTQPHRWLLPASGLLAASLLIAVAMAWMLSDANRQDAATPAPPQTASTNHKITTGSEKSPPSSNAAPLQWGGFTWDDSLDEQVAQLGQQVASLRENQLSRTDEFALMQYRIEQFRQEVQANSL